MKNSSALIVLLFLIAVSTVSAYPQVAVATGTPPFSSLGGGPFDVVNLGNLNVHFVIPVFQRSGRGVSFQYNFSYNSSIWTPVTANGVKTWTPVGGWGWQSQTDALTGYLPAPTVVYKQIDCGTPPHHIWEQYEVDTYPGFVDPLGTFHSVPNLTVTYPALDCGSQFGSTRTAGDGSGYTVTVNPNSSPFASVTPRNGTKMALGGGSVTDANGNQITTASGTTFYDNLSSSIPALTISGNAPNPVSYKYTNPQNTLVGYTMNYLPYTVKTNFGVTGITGEYGPAKNSLVSSVQLPDGSSYTFTYEQTPGSCSPIAGTQPTCVTGRILSVTLPLGGTITYGYSGGPNSTGIETDGSTAGLTRQLSPGGLWKYDRAQGTAPLWTTTVTDPNSNQTVVTFSKDNAIQYPTPNFFETERQVYQGSVSSNPLATSWKCYNGNYASCGTATVSSPITQTDAYSQLPNGSARLSEAKYNAFGLVTDDKEYDYGVTTGAAPGTTKLVRETATVYASLGNGIVNKPSSVTVSDWTSGTASTLASTTYTYDQGTPTATSGTPQHVAITGSRGNLTTLTTSTSSTASLSKTFTYYDTGTPHVLTDVNTAQTTYVYGAGSCGNSFATTINEPMSLSRSITWNCTGGVVTKILDESGNNVSTDYTDPDFWRPASVTDQLLNATTFYYNPTGTGVASNLLFNSNNSVVNTGIGFDGFGRPIVTNHLQAPGASTSDTHPQSYDSTGRLSKVYVPCATAAWTCPTLFTSMTYDALGRALTTTDPSGGMVTYTYTNNDVLQQVSGTQTFQKQFEYDGLGRLTSVCEISATLPGVGTCGQTKTQTGYWTKYTYDALGHLLTVTQNAQAASASQQKRTFTYDRLGRMTSETNPETGNGASGTVTYSYDPYSICWGAGADGDLHTRTDSAGNVTCFHHDFLHRLIDEVGWANGTWRGPVRRFRYDASANGLVSPGAGWSLANLGGRDPAPKNWTT